MKKLLFTIFLISSTVASAQNNKGEWFIDANGGARFGGKVSELSDLKTGVHLDGGVGYMINSVFGVKFDAGYDTYKTVRISDENIDRSYAIRGTVEGLISLSELFKFGVKEFDLTFHAGYGFTTHVNPSVREADEAAGRVWNDNTVKGNDDYVNIQIGLTPRYNINEQFSINLNYATLLLPIQDHYVDMGHDRSRATDLGIIHNVSLGIHYRIPRTSISRMR
jgi:hypothetical protein